MFLDAGRYVRQQRAAEVLRVEDGPTQVGTSSKRIYSAAERDGVDYNLAVVGRDFTVEYGQPLEQSYMRPLYEYGRQRALAGDAWMKRPPI